MGSIMNKAFWTTKKAKTLTDPGESVAKALEVWDKIKTLKSDSGNSVKSELDKVNKALFDLAKVSNVLKQKANSVTHKETIGYLNTYVKNCTEALSKFKACTGANIQKNIHNLPKPIMDDLKKLDKPFWIRFEDILMFLAVMKGGKGSPKIVDEYIKVGSKHEANISNDLRTKVLAAAAKGVWSGPDWTEAIEEVRRLAKTQGTQNALPSMVCVEKLMLLKAYNNM